MSRASCVETDRVLQAVGDDEKDEPAKAQASGSKRKCTKKIADIGIVDEQELRNAMSMLEPKHEAQLAALADSYKPHYKSWHFQLRCGFGLLMYGFGSKRALLEDFASSELVDGAAVVVNGYLPTISIKQVVFTLVDALCQQDKNTCPSNSQSLDELMGYLSSYRGDAIVYLIVHSIDGPGLRDASTQRILAELAALKQLHLVASIDNINAPLLWEKRVANTQFNWWWHHTPTYASYRAEAAFVPLIFGTSRVNKSIRSARLVLQSLTPNAQSVFKVLADYQLSNPEDEGLSQHELYSKCREKFLVSSELTLRAHLTEFRDHQLIRTRRSTDGQDCIFITLSAEALTKLLEDVRL